MRWSGFCIMYDPHETHAERDGELIDEKTRRFIEECRKESEESNDEKREG